MRFPRVLPALLLALSLGACHSYEPVTAPLPELAPAIDGRNEVRLTLWSGEKVILQDVYVTGGSVFGYPLHGRGPGAAQQSVPLSAIAEAHLRKPHASKSIGYLVGGALVAGTVVASAGLRSAVHQ